MFSSCGRRRRRANALGSQLPAAGDDPQTRSARAPGGDRTRRGAAPSIRLRTTIGLLALATSLATLVVIGWLLPDANQAFRELAAGRPVVRGLNAGVDQFLCCHTAELAHRAIDAIIHAVENGTISRETLASANRRVDRFSAARGHDRYRAPDDDHRSPGVPA